MRTEWLNLMGITLSMAHLQLLLPLLFSLVMAFYDARSQRIPNYLTLGCALAGLGFQLGFNGLAGAGDGLLGMVLGFGLLILFYARGGMGAGDVKALAALGVWLGARQTLYLFVYMAFSGVLLIIFYLWRRGAFRGQFKRLRDYLLSWVLLGGRLRGGEPAPATPPKAQAIPYAVAMAMGMLVICWTSLKA
jgi:prepilin peptidase CpaA